MCGVIRHKSTVDSQYLHNISLRLFTNYFSTSNVIFMHNSFCYVIFYFFLLNIMHSVSQVHYVAKSLWTPGRHTDM